ncbi:MAG: ComEC/Rec2 family competence protein, partial [marine benthic group bacterium]|nr:ComEC/Rec2 family competence protein [Candidatus Benthicola marisminoris]
MLGAHEEVGLAWTVGLLAALLIARAGLGRPRCRHDSVAVILGLAGAFAAGCALGASASNRARAACVTELETGDLVRVEGLTREHRVVGSAPRLTLRDVSINENETGRTCNVDALVVRLERSPNSLAAGSLVAVRGEWIRMGARSRWPRRPARLGIVVGRLQPRGAWPTARAHPGSWIRGGLARARARVSRRLTSRLPPQTRPIARALVLAERDDVPGEVRTRFAEAGLAHLLAISGLHIGLIGGALALALGPLLGPARAALGAAALVAVYVAMIGAPPSAVRASLLMAGWAGARARGLPSQPWELLAAAALVSVVADPLVLVEPGFQLSFAGFAGLGSGLAIGRRAGGTLAGAGRPRWIEERWPRWLRVRLGRIGLALAGGSGAFLATAPFAAAHFQHVAPVALVSHLIGTPLIAAAIGALALTVVLPPPLDALGSAGAALVLQILTAAAQILGSLPGAHAAVPAPTPWVWAAAGLAVLGLWKYARWGRARGALLPLAAAVSLALGGPSVTGRLAPGRALLCTLDVGQGDAAVLRTSRGRWILFDAGPSFGERDAGREVIVPFLRRLGARRIDLFVLSHPDQDHVGGFEAVHQSVPVFRILDSGHAVPRASYGRFLAR